MMMPHPLIPVSLPPASVTMAMNQMNHLNTIANMAAAAQVRSVPSRMVTSVIKVQGHKFYTVLKTFKGKVYPKMNILLSIMLISFISFQTHKTFVHL